MQRTYYQCVLAALAVILLIPESSDAQLLRRRRYYSGNVSNNVSTMATNTLAKVAKPFIGLIRKRSTRNRSEYDYNWAARRDWYNEDAQQMLFADKLRVKVLLRSDLQPVADSLRVRAHWVYMHKSKTWHTEWVDLKQDGQDVYFDISGLEEGRVVKVVPDVYIKSGQQSAKVQTVKKVKYIENNEGKFRYVGRIHVPYYGVTSSRTNEEFKRRAQVVSFGFSQWYADEAYGGRRCSYDCYSFFKSCTSGELNGFKLEPLSRSKVPTLAKQGKRVHGDYLIKPGHYGMALCYDEDTKNLCTLEGNYALNGPYRINIDPYRHGLNTWSSIRTISQVKEKKAEPKTDDSGA